MNAELVCAAAGSVCDIRSPTAIAPPASNEVQIFGRRASCRIRHDPSHSFVSIQQSGTGVSKFQTGRVACFCLFKGEIMSRNENRFLANTR